MQIDIRTKRREATDPSKPLLYIPLVYRPPPPSQPETRHHHHLSLLRAPGPGAHRTSRLHAGLDCLQLGRREGDGERRKRSWGCRGRGVAQGRPAEGHGGSPGPGCQGGGQPDAPAVPARARPRRRQGVGDAPQVRGVEAGGRAGRRLDAGGAGAGGPRRREGLHGRRRPRRPPRHARLPRQALLRQPRHGRLQAVRGVSARQHLCQDPSGAGEVPGHHRPEGVGVRQLRRARLHRGHRDHAELLPGEAGQGAHDPRPVPLPQGLEAGAALHRRQHQGQVRVHRRQEPGGDAQAGAGRQPDAGDVRREADPRSPQLGEEGFGERGIVSIDRSIINLLRWCSSSEMNQGRTVQWCRSCNAACSRLALCLVLVQCSSD